MLALDICLLLGYPMEVAWVMLDRIFGNMSAYKGNKQSMSVVNSVGMLFKLYFLVVLHFPHALQSLHPVSLLSPPSSLPAR